MRNTSGSTTTTSSNTVSTTGIGTSESAELICGCPEPMPETIEVEQVLGAEMAQRVVEFDMIVPARKPNIEQIVDVYVKDVEIKSIDVIPDKVIIRGDLEVKVMYVADLPNQPVHAFEKKHVRFTRDIVIQGAEPDMKASADVTVEFVDYDFDTDDPRKVHITIVLKFWARVITQTTMDVTALTPIDEVGTIEVTTAVASDVTSASATGGGNNSVSASQTGGGDTYAGYSPENMIVTGMTPVAGTTMTTTGKGTVTGSSVNVRTGPGTNFPVVTKVNLGATVTVQDTAFGWYKVALADGTTGWIASWLVDLTNQVPTTPKG